MRLDGVHLPAALVAARALGRYVGKTLVDAFERQVLVSRRREREFDFAEARYLGPVPVGALGKAALPRALLGEAIEIDVGKDDLRLAFGEAFKKAGGEIVGSVHTPMQNPNFGPFIQRVKDAKPEAVFLFLPAGAPGIAFMKGYEERGLKEAGIKLIATGDITDDTVLESMGAPAIGLITSFHYSADHKSPENDAFKKAYVEANGTKLWPNFIAAAGYDGMALIYEALKKTNGSTDGDKLVAAMKGAKWMSPRGAVMIDLETPSNGAEEHCRKRPSEPASRRPADS